jgi:hypothetical protein
VDEAVWRRTANGVFTVKSAYNMFFLANVKFACAKPIWKSKAPMKCKFFMWLAVHRRCLTADNLQRRGWPHNVTCPLCSVASETCTHLFVHCRFSHKVWSKVRDWTKADSPAATSQAQKNGGWGRERRLPKFCAGTLTLWPSLYTGDFGRNATAAFFSRSLARQAGCSS